MPKTILLADDESKIVILLTDFLKTEGFGVVSASDGREALDVFHANKEIIDLVLLDVMMPHIDGWTVCREIRKDSEVPVWMLTARSEDYDEIHGFEIGADDYVKKPVRPAALIARINAFFRRMEKEDPDNHILKTDKILVDKDSHIVRINDENLRLSPKEYTMLLLLMENKGKVVSREQLLNQVWGYDYFGGLRTVDTHINRLRIKLKDAGSQIATVRGFGYRFEG